MPDASPERISAVIIAGGDPIDAMVLARLPAECFVVAADSGLDEAIRLGLRPQVVIGDMDSVSEISLQGAHDNGAEVVTHPTDKDATDLELALEHVYRRGHRHAILCGGYGGRISHFLGNALVITAARFAAMRIEWHVGTTSLAVVRPDLPLIIEGSPGDLVSLLAPGGSADGVATSGLRWPLAYETLPAGSTRGISNEMLDDRAAISLQAGVLLALHERISP